VVFKNKGEAKIVSDAINAGDKCHLTGLLRLSCMFLHPYLGKWTFRHMSLSPTLNEGP
jgi:hypothetical protein